MPDLDPFLEQVRANPGDEALRLVYADWLDECGDARADFLRARRQWQQLPPGDGQIEPLGRRLDATRQQYDPAWLAVIERHLGIPEVPQASYPAWLQNTPAGALIFWAPWSGADRQLRAVLEPLSRRWFPAFQVGGIDVDVNLDLAQQLRIYNVPTLLYHAGGAVVDRSLGFRPASAVDAAIRAMLTETRRELPCDSRGSYNG